MFPRVWYQNFSRIALPRSIIPRITIPSSNQWMWKRETVQHFSKFFSPCFYSTNQEEISNIQTAQEESQDAAYLEKLAFQYMDNGQYDKAVSVLETVLGIIREEELVPAKQEEKAELLKLKATVLGNIGFVYSQMQDYDSSMQFYIEALKLDPHNYILLSNAGVLFHQNSKLREAIAMYEQALQIQPEDSMIRYRYAQALIQETKNAEKYEEQLRLCVATDLDNFIEPYGDLAIALARNNPDEALQIAQEMQAKNKDKKSVLPYHVKAYILAVNERYDEAVEVYSEAIEINPQDFESYFNIALLKEKQNDLDTALQFVAMTLELNPENTNAVSVLSRLLEKIGREDEAEAMLKQYAEKHPKNGYLITHLAATLIRLKKFDEAQELIDDFNSKYPEMSELMKPVQDVLNANRE